jgi:hypothetical protein
MIQNRTAKNYTKNFGVREILTLVCNSLHGIIFRVYYKQETHRAVAFNENKKDEASEPD